MEHLTLEVKFAAGEAGLVSGYASLFGRPADYVNDVIEAGAFRATISAHDGAGTMPAMLREHKGDPVGLWLEIEEDELGLRVKGQIDLDTQEGREAYEAVRTGKIDGLSIGYRAQKAERDPSGARTLQEIELHEISLVRRPAASRARVLSVKSAPAGATAAKGAAILKRKTMEQKATAPGGDPGNGETATAEDRVGGLESKVTDIDTRLSAVEEKVGAVKSVADRIEAKLSRPGATIEKKAEPEKIETKAFGSFLRQGREALGVDEVKALRVADDTAGGYLAPAEFVAQVIKGIVEFSPVRQAAKVGSTSSGSVILPKRTGRPTAHWVGETEDRTETGSTYGQVEIPVHETACYVDVSQRLLEDAAVNVEAEVSADLAEEFGRIEGVAFVNGDGVKKPLGFMNDAGVGVGLNGHATALGADALIGLMYSLPAFYRNRGSWMMNGTTLATVRKLKDGQGNYLWQPSYQAGQPETLLGRPVVEAVDMPDVASGTFPIAFGDFATAYRIYDRVSLSVLRDPYTVATKGLVRFHARRRVGGGVVLGEALTKLKMATS
ncbi:Phage major capsid protein [Hyphomicrobiales bacterium]|nr:Phage major capsid protein [Hyphomicrobiales bacterium]CAH1673381.1 Phage major capsid protein [Hyphomicrobiales bacterium]